MPLDFNIEKLTSEQQAFIEKSSWGPLLGFWWALFSRRPFLSLIFFVPIVNIVAVIYYIIDGRQAIWDSGRWKNFESFKRRQEAIDSVSKGLFFAIVAVIGLIIMLYVFAWGWARTA